MVRAGECNQSPGGGWMCLAVVGGVVALGQMITQVHLFIFICMHVWLDYVGPGRCCEYTYICVSLFFLFKNKH